MAKRVLVAYATKSGSTREIAELITKVLQEKGLETDIQEMKNVKSVSNYDAFVIGAPMYMFRFIGDLPKFIKKFRKEIEKTPTAFFSLGPTADTEKDWKTALRFFQRRMVKFYWFHPVVREFFGGRLDSTKLVFPYNLLPGKNSLPQGDIRDWDKIKAWAESLPGKFNL
jgi:menaquinone-dependent protoporphyrinogen oxidase